MDNFVSDLSERARQLVWSLDERYDQWAGQLPDPFQELARTTSTFSGRSGEQFYRLSSSVNPVNMHSAWLFWDLFSGLPNEVFLQIAEAGAFWSLSAILLDHLVDSQVQNPALSILFQHKLLQKSRTGFREIFPQSSPFWAAFSRYESAYIDALASEGFIQEHPDQLTYAIFVETARAKAATMLVTLAAFSEATGQPGLLAPIERSIELCAQAGQLYDDLQDWQIDLASRHITWVLVRIYGQRVVFSSPMPEHQETNTKLDDSGLSLEILQEVLLGLTAAEEAVAGLNCPGWNNFLEDYRKIVRRDQKASAAKFLQRSFSPVIGGKELHPDS